MNAPVPWSPHDAEVSLMTEPLNCRDRGADLGAALKVRGGMLWLEVASSESLTLQEQAHPQVGKSAWFCLQSVGCYFPAFDCASWAVYPGLTLF